MCLLLLILIAVLVPVPRAQASDCDYYRKTDQQDLYKLYCSGGSSSTKPAGANSTFADAFNINSASLPTEPSSYGLESIGSYLRSDPTTLGGTFSLIKGYHRFGTGVSTSSNNTFYGNDVVERLDGPADVTSFTPSEPALGHVTNLNLGTSVNLFDLSDGPSVRLGISLRYNKITNTWGSGPGLMVSWNSFTLGAGFTNEQVSNELPEMTFENFLLSTRLSIFELEYDLMTVPAEAQLSPIQIFTLSIRINRLSLSGAVRFLNYMMEGNVVQEQVAIQYMFTQHLSAGFLYNYIPGADSIGTQIYL